MKGHDRNAPCPCGSGRKAKRCCDGPAARCEREQAKRQAAREREAAHRAAVQAGEPVAVAEEGRRQTEREKAATIFAAIRALGAGVIGGGR